MIVQAEAILHHLKNIGPITPLEALKLYGCLRLGARVYDLRQELIARRSEFDIVTVTIHQYGKHFASYQWKRIEDKQPEEIPVKTIEIPQGKQAQMAFAI